MSTWQQLSVTDFFTQGNWEGKQQAAQVVQGSSAPKPISVSQLVEKVETKTRADKPLVFPQHLASPCIPIADWHLLPVEEMFRQHNWEGTKKPNQVQPKSSGVSVAAAAVPSTTTIATPSAAPVAVTSGTKELSLVLSVQDFLGCISWDGIPAIGVLPELKNPTANSDQGDEHITLDDFSQLF